jgi:hypothetical protein
MKFGRLKGVDMLKFTLLLNIVISIVLLIALNRNDYKTITSVVNDIDTSIFGYILKVNDGGEYEVLIAKDKQGQETWVSCTSLSKLKIGDRVVPIGANGNRLIIGKD